MEAGKLKLDGLFSRGKNLEIPFFQRDYVWEEKNWERFLDDMSSVSTLDRDYFMGSVILKQQNVSTGMSIGDRRTVIDGQQRLTTILLFFKALSDICGESKLMDYFRDRNDKIILVHNKNDKEAFDKVLSCDKNALTADGNSDSKIFQCYHYFVNKIQDYSIDPIKILNHIYFIYIDVQKDEDEQQIFETINSLGMKLTTAALLKNHIFSQDQVELYNKTWHESFEKNEETRYFWDKEINAGRNKRANIDVLLQAYFTIIAKKEFGIDGAFLEYKQFLQKYDKTNTPEKHRDFVLNLVEYAKIYQKCFNQNNISDEIEANNYINRINIIIFIMDTTTVIPYCLYILKNVSKKDEQDRIFKVIETYIIRRMICGEPSKNYSTIFTRLIIEEIDSAEKLKQKLQIPSNEDFQDHFKNVILVNNKIKGLLYLIEISIRDSNRVATQLKGIEKYALEHIMPKAWEKNWSLPNNSNIEDRKKSIQLIGNTTLLTQHLNASLKNSAWDLKKTEFQKYCDGIKTFVSYREVDIWDENLIKKRTEDLFIHAKEIWSID